MINKLNHITIAVSDVDRSFDFYTKVLGFKPHVKWNNGAYLTIGDTWFCLNVGSNQQNENSTHIAFTVNQNEFDIVKTKLEKYSVSSWKENISEGDSFYFLDPDNYKLEIHVGNLETRLASLKLNPPTGIKWYKS